MTRKPQVRKHGRAWTVHHNGHAHIAESWPDAMRKAGALLHLDMIAETFKRHRS